MIKNYRLGLVFTRAGITDYQSRLLVDHVTEVCKHVEGLHIHVPGLTVEEPELSVAPSVLALAGMSWGTEVKVSVTGFEPGSSTESIAAWIKNCDEILGFPARGKRRWMADRVWNLYKLFEAPRPGQPRMKIIEHWHGEST